MRTIQFWKTLDPLLKTEDAAPCVHEMPFVREPHLEIVLDLGIQKLTGIFPRSSDEIVLEGPLELVRCVASF